MHLLPLCWMQMRSSKLCFSRLHSHALNVQRLARLEAESGTNLYGSFTSGAGHDACALCRPERSAWTS